MAVVRPARDEAFSLLEILSVVAIFALLAGLALPNFSSLHTRNLDNQAKLLVSQIELARQRAIVTGIPHRLFIDIDGAAYRIEWLVNDEQEFPDADEEDAGPGAFDALEASALGPSDLLAPRDELRDYRPVPGPAGRFVEFADSVEFTSIETTGGRVEAGETWIQFEPDGTAEFTTIVMEHESGPALSLEVLPLADRVRVYHETL